MSLDVFKAGEALSSSFNAAQGSVTPLTGHRDARATAKCNAGRMRFSYDDALALWQDLGGAAALECLSIRQFPLGN